MNKYDKAVEERVTLKSYQELMAKYADMEKSYNELQQELKMEKVVTEKAIADYENVVAMLDRERFNAKGTLEKLQQDLKASKILIDCLSEKCKALTAENEELKARV